MVKQDDWTEDTEKVDTSDSELQSNRELKCGTFERPITFTAKELDWSRRYDYPVRYQKSVDPRVPGSFVLEDTNNTDAFHHVSIGFTQPTHPTEPTARGVPYRPVYTPSQAVLAVLLMVITWLVLMSLTGCSRDARAPEAPVTAPCYAAAILKADAAANGLCGGVWSTCPQRESILAQLDRELELCDSVESER
jgi:hypothetical protein